MMAGSKLSMWVLTVCWMGMNLAQAEERSPAQAQGTGGTTAAPVVVPRGYGYQYEHVYWWNPTTRQYEFRWVIVPYGYGAATAAGEETAPAQAAATPRGYSPTEEVGRGGREMDHIARCRMCNQPLPTTPRRATGLRVDDRTPIRRFAGSETEANGSGDSTKSLSESAISRAVVAGELAVWGRQNKQATALALAASMLQSTRFVASEQKKHDEQVVREVKADPKKATEVSADSLLAEARTMAGSDKPTLAAVEAIAASMPKAPAPARGYAVGGPYRISSQVRSRSIDTWDVELRGGQTAEVGLIGDGDTDLDLVVYDEYGNRVASDTDGTDRCYVRWTPRWTGKFYVRVVNHGDVYNVYRLMIP